MEKKEWPTIEEVREQINEVSPSFCLAKWYFVSLHLHVGDNHSCYHPKRHSIDLEDVKKNPQAIHNTRWKKLQRKAMLEGERPKECHYCWAIEDLPGNPISDRTLRSSENWSYDLMEKTAEMPWDADVYPTYLEVSFGNECNFKCSYCTPAVSSSWFNETKKFGDWNLANNLNERQYTIGTLQSKLWKKEKENPYIEAFWNWFPDAYEHIRVLRLTGGEPLLSSNVYKVMDFIEDHPHPNLEFNINSNMGIPRRNLDKAITRIKSMGNQITFKMYTSIDTWGPQAEWIRNGLDLELFESNCRHYLKELPQSQLCFMVACNALSIPNFDLFLKKILELRKEYSTKHIQRIEFDTPFIVEPSHLTGSILTDEWIDLGFRHLKFLEDNIDDDDKTKFSSLEQQKLSRMLNWMKESRFQDPWLSLNRGDFYRFVIEHDRRRGTNFLQAFPEMERFLELCKGCADG